MAGSTLSPDEAPFEHKRKEKGADKEQTVRPADESGAVGGPDVVADISYGLEEAEEDDRGLH